MQHSTGFWTGTLAAPLPMIVLMIIALALTVGLSETLAVFVLVAYVIVLVPLAVAYGVLRLTRTRSLLAYAGTMFVITLLAGVAGWQFLSFSPESSISIEWGDGVEQPVPLPIVGVVAATLLALVETACMIVFWMLAIRPAAAQRSEL